MRILYYLGCFGLFPTSLLAILGLCLVWNGAIGSLFIQASEESSRMRPEELDLSLLISPLPCWGRNMRNDKSPRVLVFGGSNSDDQNLQIRWKWPVVLRQLLADEYTPEKSYVLNQAAAAMGPTYRIGMTFEFETAEPASNWPNMVILEYGVNCHRSLSCPDEIDRLIQFLNDKWTLMGLEPPSYLIFELWCDKLSGSLKDKEDTPEARLVQIHQFDRSIIRNPFLVDFARFNRYPMISFADAAFPAFVRHYLNSTADDYWYYTEENCHINEAGSLVAVRDMIMPFIHKQMEPKPGDQSNRRCALYDDPRISYFNPRNVDMTLNKLYKFQKRWSSWHQEESLHHIVVPAPNTTWGFVDLRGHEEHHTHMCYGSMVKGTSATFKIRAYDSCREETPCLLSITYVHSWNTSYIGDARCGLFVEEKDHSRHRVLIGDYVQITGSLYKGMAVKDTTPREVALPNVTQAGRKHVVVCENLSEDRLACFSEVRMLLTARAKNHPHVDDVPV